MKTYKYLPSANVNSAHFYRKTFNPKFIFGFIYSRTLAYSLYYINHKFIYLFRSKYILYEFPLPIIIASIVKKGDFIIDVGAYIGYYTFFFSKLVGKEGKVYAFEPEPRAFLILKNKAKRLKNVILERKAVGDKNTKVKFYLDENRGESSIYKDLARSKTCIEVDMIRLDDYFHDLKDNIALIKMDVQGSEPLVIDGMKNLIKKVKLLILELWPYGLKVAGFEPSDIINRLILNDFKIIYIDEDFYVITRNIEKYVNIDHKNIYYYINIIGINKNYLKI
jgi:FkbM family methyltransferase